MFCLKVNITMLRIKTYSNNVNDILKIHKFLKIRAGSHYLFPNCNEHSCRAVKSISNLRNKSQTNFKVYHILMLTKHIYVYEANYFLKVQKTSNCCDIDKKYIS